MGIHHSFRNIARKQEFAIDDIIGPLKEQRNEDLAFLIRSVESVEKSISAGKILGHFALSGGLPYKELKDTHNAYLMALALKESGVKTLQLDASKDLSEQVLEIADKEMREHQRQQAIVHSALSQNSVPK